MHNSVLSLSMLEQSVSMLSNKRLFRNLSKVSHQSLECLLNLCIGSIKLLDVCQKLFISLLYSVSIFDEFSKLFPLFNKRRACSFVDEYTEVWVTWHYLRNPVAFSLMLIDLSFQQGLPGWSRSKCDTFFCMQILFKSLRYILFPTDNVKLSNVEYGTVCSFLFYHSTINSDDRCDFSHLNLKSDKNPN